MVSPTSVRIAGPPDVGTLAALRRSWREDGPDPEFDKRFAAWLAGEGDRRTVWVAEAGGVAVGMATLLEYRRMPVPGRADGRWGYLGNMFVLADHRDHGVGRDLLDVVLAAADARGYARVVLSPSARAVPFYRRAGFVDAGEGAGDDRLLVRPAARP